MRPLFKGGSRSRNNSLLVWLGQLIRDAMLAEQFARKLAGVLVAGHTADTIGFQQCREVIDDCIRRERRAGLANPVLGLVRDGQREAVIGAAARISESSKSCLRPAASRDSRPGATFNDFRSDEALDVRAKLREILRRRAGGFRAAGLVLRKGTREADSKAGGRRGAGVLEALPTQRRASVLTGKEAGRLTRWRRTPARR